MKFSTALSTLALAAGSLAASDSTSSTASVQLTTYSVLVSRYGAFFTRVQSQTVGESIAYVEQYLTDTNILAYTIGDAAGSSSFYSRLSEYNLTADETTAATATADDDSTATTAATTSEDDSTTSSADESTSSSTGAAASLTYGAGALGAVAALLLL